jgi:hypothetical protein
MTDYEMIFSPGGLVPVDVETTAGLVREILRLRKAMREIDFYSTDPWARNKIRIALDSSGVRNSEKEI